MKLKNLNQFRLGNYVYGNWRIMQQIDYIYRDGVIGLLNNCGGTDKYQISPIISNDIRKIKPVKLDEAIIIGSGFKKMKDKDCNVYCKTFNKRKNAICITQDADGNYYIVAHHKIIIEYVHQLQNIWFILTNEELVIKKKRK